LHIKYDAILPHPDTIHLFFSQFNNILLRSIEKIKKRLKQLSQLAFIISLNSVSAAISALKKIEMKGKIAKFIFTFAQISVK
jgi:predicted MarR family transcription regulator